MKQKFCFGFKRSGKGFTLVELLIVIVVIGVLSAMMMLSSTEAVSSAKAANVINNLRNWKTATLAWYTDNIDKVDDRGWILDSSGKYEGKFKENNVVKAKDIMPYLGGGLMLKDNKVVDSSGGIYTTYYIDNRDTLNTHHWLITYELPTKDNDKRLMEKIASRAKAAGLVNKNPSAGAEDPYTAEGGNHYWVAIKVLDFKK